MQANFNATKKDVIELRILIHEGRITLEELYNLKASNHCYNSLNKILRAIGVFNHPKRLRIAFMGR